MQSHAETMIQNFCECEKCLLVQRVGLSQFRMKIMCHWVVYDRYEFVF